MLKGARICFAVAFVLVLGILILQICSNRQRKYSYNTFSHKKINFLEHNLIKNVSKESLFRDKRKFKRLNMALMISYG